MLGKNEWACMYVFVWNCASIHRDAHFCVCARAGQRSALNDFPYLFLMLFLEAASLIEPGTH